MNYDDLDTKPRKKPRIFRFNNGNTESVSNSPASPKSNQSACASPSNSSSNAIIAPNDVVTSVQNDDQVPVEREKQRETTANMETPSPNGKKSKKKWKAKVSKLMAELLPSDNSENSISEMDIVEEEKEEDMKEIDENIENVDIGLSFLNHPNEFEYEIPELPESTGFMNSIKALKTRIIKSVNIKSSIADMEIVENNGKQAEEIPKKESTEVVKIMSSDSEGDENDVEFVGDYATDQEKEDGDSIIITHSKIVNEAPEEFIIFDSEDEDNQYNDENSPRKTRLNWKSGMSRRELDDYYEDVIDDLCMIEKIPPWFDASSSNDSSVTSFKLTSVSDRCSAKDGWYISKNVVDILQKEIEDFVSYISPSQKEHMVRKYVVRSVASVVHGLWPTAKVSVFGSFQTKLYLPSSDLDIVIMIPTNRKVSKLNPFHKLAALLKKNRMATDLNIISNARVPLVKYVDTFAGYKVDISFNVDSGVESSKIISSFLGEHEGLYPISVLMKQFLSIRGLNEVFTGGLGSYGLSAITTSFLQLHPRLNANEIDEKDNLAVLLLEYLDLYGKRFNYDRVGISLRNGGRYFIKGRLGNLGNPRPFSLTVEDPQDTSNDICKGSFNMHQVCSAMSYAFDCLTTAMYEHLGRQRDYSDVRIRSLLSTIVYIHEDVIEHRQMVAKKFDDLPAFAKNDTEEFKDGLVPNRLYSFGKQEEVTYHPQFQNDSHQFNNNNSPIRNNMGRKRKLDDLSPERNISYSNSRQFGESSNSLNLNNNSNTTLFDSKSQKKKAKKQKQGNNSNNNNNSNQNNNNKKKKNNSTSSSSNGNNNDNNGGRKNKKNKKKKNNSNNQQKYN